MEICQCLFVVIILLMLYICYNKYVTESFSEREFEESEKKKCKWDRNSMNKMTKC
jgi:hypothetical protein